MKELLEKMSQLEASAPKSSPSTTRLETAPKNVPGKKQVLKESAVRETAPLTLKGLFEQLSEAAPAAIPVMQQGSNKASSMGVISVNDTSPAGKALNDTLSNLAQQKKLQVVTPQVAGQGQAPVPGGQQPAASAAGSPNPNQVQPMKEEELDEISSDLLARAAAKAGTHRDAASTAMRQVGGDRSKDPGVKFWQDKTDKFSQGADQAKERERKQANYKRQTSSMSPAQKRQFDAKYKDQLEEKWAGDTKLNPDKKGMFNGKTKAELEKQLASLHKSGPHKKGSPEYTKQQELNFAIRAKSGWKKPVDEADIPSVAGMDTMGASLGAGRSQTTLEGRAKADNKAEKAGKKVTKDLEYDMYHKGKDDKKAEKAGKKVTKDIEWDEKHPKKKTVKENMSNRIRAARLEGKSHGLRGHSYSGKNYEDMEECMAYHNGYKEGLDECYGMSPMEEGVYEDACTDCNCSPCECHSDHAHMRPIQGLVKEAPRATVSGMADQAIEEDEFEEGNAFTAALARTPNGGRFKLGGKTFNDRSGYNAKIDEYAFESWDKELAKLINEGEEVSEGLSVSISKDNPNSPDSVNVNATDAEADKLLAIVKQAGMGIFGGDEPAEAPRGMSAAPSSETNTPGDIEVVGDHDDMLSLMKRLSGVESSGGSEDYADEEGDAGCEECGQATCECGAGPMRQIGEVQSEEQLEYEVAEDNAAAGAQNPPDNGSANSSNDTAGTAAANSALASADQTDRPTMAEDEEDSTDSEEDEAENLEEDDLEESYQLDEWANDAGPGKSVSDTTFEQDIDFMTRVISGGLNKPKSTGQTTIPVIAGEKDRMGYSVNESLSDWTRLAGLK